MYPVENMLLARLLCQERLMEAERDRRLRQSVRQQPRFLARVRLWTGTTLMRLGNRVLPGVPTAHPPVRVSHHGGVL